MDLALGRVLDPGVPGMTPTLPPAVEAILAALGGLNFKLPGESIITALINLEAQREATMDPALLKRLDTVIVQQTEDLQKIWRGIWVATGLLT